jgi:hypothetical protein
MTARSRIAVGAAAACLVAVALVAPAAAVAPKGGDYQGCPTKIAPPGQHCESEGYFTLKGGKIKPFGSFGGILAPSDFVCNQLNAKLEAKSIPVSGGAFDYKGTAKIGYGPSPTGPFKRMDIHFKGSWKSASTVAGYTRISGKNSRGQCDSGKIAWKMKTPPP